jgi:hypothetical protein
MRIPGFGAEAALTARAGRPWAARSVDASPEIRLAAASAHARGRDCSHCESDALCECLCRNAHCRSTGRCIPTVC